MLSCSIRFSAPSFWMGGGLESCCVHSGSQDHHPSKNSVQETICCNSVSNDPHARHHPHRKHDLRSGSQDHHPSKNSVQKTICCNSISNAPHARHHPHRKHDLRSDSQDRHPSKDSVQKTICCNSTSNAPDDGRMYPKHVELRIHQ